MFGLSKKSLQITSKNENEVDNYNSNFELSDNDFNSQSTSNNNGSIVDNFDTMNMNTNNEPSVLKNDGPAWDQTLDFADDISWSKVLISESENLRHTGIINRQKDSPMVILVKRLELFPSVDLINKVRANMQKDVSRLNSVKDAMQSQDNEQNPILTQTGIELTSELNKIVIEMEAFEAKIKSEIQIIQNLAATIIHNGKSITLIKAILQTYDFDYDTETGIINHKSNYDPNKVIPVRVNKLDFDYEDLTIAETQQITEDPKPTKKTTLPHSKTNGAIRGIKEKLDDDMSFVFGIDSMDKKDKVK